MHYLRTEKKRTHQKRKLKRKYMSKCTTPEALREVKERGSEYLIVNKLIVNKLHHIV